MSEKASCNEGADEAAETDADLPGISAGEELALGPIEGEEIDPLPKWWDEPFLAEKSKSGNRRLEDGIEFEAPRRKKPLPPLHQEDLSLPIARSGPREALPEMGDLPLPVKSSGIGDGSDFPELVQVEEDTDLFLTIEDPMPEFELASTSLKRQRRDALENAGGGLDDFFEGFGDGSAEETPASGEERLIIETVETLEEGAEGEEIDFDMPDFPKKDVPKPEMTSRPEPEPEPEPEASSAAPPITLFLTAQSSQAEPELEAAHHEEIVEAPSESGPAASGESEAPQRMPVVETAVVTSIARAEPQAESPGSEESIVAIEPVGRDSKPLQPGEEPAPAESDSVEEVRADDGAKTPDPEEPVSPAFVGGSELSISGSDSVAEVVSVGAEPKKKAGCWTVFATVFFFSTVLLLMAVGGAAAYAWSRFGDFEKGMTSLITTQLEERGIALDYETWRYEFPRGVVLDEVTLYDDATKARPAIKVAGLGVNIDFLSLASQTGAVGAAEFSLRDSKVTLFQKGELFAEINGVDGEIFVDASAVTVERLTARVGGLRVDLDGIVRLPDKTISPPVASADAPAPGEKASVLASLDFSGFRAAQPWLGIEGSGSQPPLLSFSFEMDAEEPDLATIQGNLGGSDLNWRGIRFESLSASFRVDPKTGELRFPNVQIGYGEGMITAVFAIDMAEQKLRIESLQSTIDPIALIKAIDPTRADLFTSVRLADAPALRISGEMPLGDPSNANLKIRYEHRGGGVYVDGGRELPLSDLRGQFTYDRGALETNDAAGNLFGGQLHFNGAIHLVRERRPFTGLIEITGMDLKKAGEWFGASVGGMEGRLSLIFRGTGNADVASLNGGGNLRIEEAVLSSFPAIGPVQQMIGKVVPAFASKGGGIVAGSYILESGVLVTSDLTSRNSGARFITSGNVNLASKATSFVTTADLEPVLAAATGLKDKSVEVEGTGPLDRPVLKIRRFPVEFAAVGLGEVLGTSSESLGGLRELVGSENAAEVITGRLEEATGLELDPAVTDLLKGLFGEEAAPSAPVPAPIRAVPRQ